jgi:hypothetical protein
MQMSIQLANKEDLLYEEVQMALLRFDALFERTTHLRYGQLFMILCLPRMTWPELFYQENRYIARNMIEVKITDWQNAEFVNRMIGAEEIKRANANKINGLLIFSRAPALASPRLELGSMQSLSSGA